MSWCLELYYVAVNQADEEASTYETDYNSRDKHRQKPRDTALVASGDDCRVSLTGPK